MLDILAIIPLRPSWEQMIYFSLMGFGIVLIVLAALSAISSVVGVFFKKYDAAQAAAKAAPQVAAPKAPAAKGVSPEVSKEHEFVISAAVAAVLPDIQDEGRELLAVLTAAAAVALEEECSVVSFKEARPDMSYAYEGRMQIFASKTITPARVKF